MHCPSARIKYVIFVQVKLQIFLVKSLVCSKKVISHQKFDVQDEKYFVWGQSKTTFIAMGEWGS